MNNLYIERVKEQIRDLEMRKADSPRRVQMELAIKTLKSLLNEEFS